MRTLQSTIKSLIFSASIVLTLLCFWQTEALAQKMEVEKRVSKDEFPAPALQFLTKEYPGLRKDRYFKEFEGDTTNFEAKFCWQKERYSIEFQVDGSLKDIEKQVKFSSIPSEIRKLISQELDASFKKWRVSRCQVQQVPGRIEQWYEIEIKGKDHTGAVQYEYLFDDQGILVRKREIILPSNLINQY